MDDFDFRPITSGLGFHHGRPADVKPVYEAEMLLLFNALRSHGAEFGYRTAHEAARFIHFYKMLGNHLDGDTGWFIKAFDCVIF
jgi:hypothetical protein